MTKFTATPQQKAFYNELLSGTSHIVLRARAGCGKSTAIVGGVDALMAYNGGDLEIQVCAYNKAIADEMTEKLKAHGHTDWRKVSCQTLHGMGFGLLRFMFKPKVDGKKVANIVAALNDPAANEYTAQIIQLVDTAKQEGFGFFDNRQIGDTGAWYEMAEHYGVNSFENTSDMDAVVALAQRVYNMSLAQTDVIDFNDMILMPLVKNIRVKFQKDILFVDEAQDLSRARQALARKFVKRTGRMVIVGDDRQAIYGFSGADAAALNNLTEQLHAKVLPLSVTWRCPKAVVALAQRIVPDIEAAPTAPEGVVGYITELPGDLGAETAILCRNTAPLIDMAYNLIRGGTACKVEGRDIGEGLKNLTSRWKVKTIDAFLNRLNVYQDREVQKAQAKGKDERIQQIEDKCDTLRAIASECIKQARKMVADMDAFIDDLFADGAENVTVLATYHRSKGREWQRVILVEHAARCPSPFAKKAWQFEQEENLEYVAITRSQEQLLFLG